MGKVNVADQFNLRGKTAIITGASKGIGKSIAHYFGEQGANLVISSRNQESIDNVVDEFVKKGINVKGMVAHMGNLEQIQKLVSYTVENYQSIDIVVNNAAINPVFGSINETTDDAFDKIFQVNVKGPLELSKIAYPYLLKSGGNIINISSIEGITPGNGLGLYSMSKSALISMTKTMAREWGPAKIRVNAICPGLVRTKFSEALTSNEKILKYVLAKQALPDIAEPEHIAGLALFLASDAGAFCTGGVYMADGGYTI